MKLWMGKPITPRFEKFTDQIGNVSSGPEIIDVKMRVSRVQCEGSRNGDAYDRRFTVACKEFFSVGTKERLSVKSGEAIPRIR